MRYKQTTEPITQIAHELGVDAIVEGAVVRSGDHVTVTAQLIDAAEDRHLWAHTYDRKVEDLLAMEAELSREIATQVGGTLSSQRGSEAATLRHVDSHAHELYLKGRYFWNKRTDEGGRKATEYFQQAVNLDPNYAEAYVGLADCYVFGQPPTDPPKILATKAKAMANRALELDDGLGEAHATLGLVAQNLEWDWAGAEREYKAAIQLDPNYATAHQWYGEELALTGKFNEAIQELNLASRLDPLSLIIIKDTGEAYYAARKEDQAIEYFRRVLEMDPSFVVARLYLGMAYVQKGEFSSAISEFKRAEKLQGSPDALTELGYTYAVSGQRQAARRILSELNLMSARRRVDPSYFAVVYAGLGEKDNAFEWLERAYNEHALLTGLKVDPQWDNLRTDPRFANLMRRVGLPT
jgi:tetratricopeptide (TPR) repeat protein